MNEEMYDGQKDNGDKYQGWTNRETWAAHLWLSNNEGLYHMAREVVAEDGADGIKYLIEGFEDSVVNPDTADLGPANDSMRTMMADIGSLWRVNWVEVAEAFAAE